MSIGDVVEAILSSKYLIAFTGAGISAESGIPTFRGENGLWRKYKPEELATPEAFRRNPRLVWEWYKWRMEIVFKAKPNRAHYALAELESLGLLKCVITQNVDGLHWRAGSRCVVELHGSLYRVRCIGCSYKSELREPPKAIPPKCPVCGNLLRPSVVWFGEPLPSSEWTRALNHAYKADTVLVIGTSGVVYPAAYIPFIVKENKGVVIEINISDTPITSIADIVIRERAGKAMEEIIRAIKEGMGFTS